MSSIDAYPIATMMSPTGLATPEGSDVAASPVGTPAVAGEKVMVQLLRDGDYAGCIAVLEESQKLTSRMINMGFTAKVESGHSVESAAVELLQKCQNHGITPSQSMHNNVLAAVSKSSPPEAVLAWLARMRDGSVRIDRVACNTQLKAHLAMGDVAVAAKLLTEMMRGGESAGDLLPTPDAISYNTVISAMANANQPEKAEALLNAMADTGVEADRHSYTSVISGFAKAGKPTRASKWLKRMLESGVLPDTVVFNTVLHAYAQAADASGARAVVREFEKRTLDECPNARPDVVSYNTFISACARADLPAEAESAFHELVASGLQPNQATLSTM